VEVAPGNGLAQLTRRLGSKGVAHIAPEVHSSRTEQSDGLPSGADGVAVDHVDAAFEIGQLSRGRRNVDTSPRRNKNIRTGTEIKARQTNAANRSRLLDRMKRALLRRA
jgi:hypothetical protein